MDELMKVTLDLSPYWGDLTNEEVAAAVGVHVNSVSNWKKGVDRARLEHLVKLKNFFSTRTGRKLKIEDLLKIEED